MFKGIGIHTFFNIYQLFNFQKQDGRVSLAKALNLHPIDELDDLRTQIRVDFLYDNISFAAEKGFPWSHIQTVLTFADGFLKMTKGKVYCSHNSICYSRYITLIFNKN